MAYISLFALLNINTTSCDFFPNHSFSWQPLISPLVIHKWVIILPLISRGYCSNLCAPLPHQWKEHESVIQNDNSSCWWFCCLFLLQYSSHSLFHHANTAVLHRQTGTLATHKSLYPAVISTVYEAAVYCQLILFPFAIALLLPWSCLKIKQSLIHFLFTAPCPMNKNKWNMDCHVSFLIHSIKSLKSHLIYYEVQLQH